MKRSAASSSSAVVTPGWHFARSRRRQRAWITPAAAIRSICSGVFLMIIRDPLGGENRAGRGRRPTGEASVVETYVSETVGRGQRHAKVCSRLELFFHAQGGEQGSNPVVDLVGLQGAVDPPQQPLALVVVHQRLRLRVVLLETVANDLGLVVIADLQAGAADVTDALVLRGIELDVEDVPLLDACAATAEAPYDLIVRDLDQDCCGQLAAELFQPRVQRFGLGDRPRKAVEDEPIARLAT